MGKNSSYFTESDRRRKIPEIGELTVVFKVMERCNINCSYCYYFNMGNNDAIDRPPKVSIDTVENVAQWIAHGLRDLGISQVKIAFHGGEPMMVKPKYFDRFCQILKTPIEKIANVKFAIQTNGTILCDEWLEVFSKYRVHIGVSIDGHREAHDRFRNDHRGRSTFDITENNLKKLIHWDQNNSSGGLSVIAVMNWQNDYKEIYNYFRKIGIKQMSFLLPDCTRDSRTISEHESLTAYGESYSDIFDEWLKEDDQTVKIRQIRERLKIFQSENNAQKTLKSGRKLDFQVIVIQSDGALSFSDSYIPADYWYSRLPKYSIDTISLPKFLGEPAFEVIDSMIFGLPKTCKTCEWRGTCRGGDIENRYSADNGFDNPSIYCEDYKVFCSNIFNRLVSNGYPKDLALEKIARANSR